MILVFAFLFIFWGACLWGGQRVTGWNWPTLAALRRGGGVTGRRLTCLYWFAWSGLYLTSAIATAHAILRLRWILQSYEEDPILWGSIAVGIPVLLFSTYCVFQDLQKERSGVREDF